MKDGKVISLRLARRVRSNRRKNRNPIAGESAILIPFPLQIGPKRLAAHADRGLDRRTLVRRKVAKAAKPMADGRRRDRCRLSDASDGDSTLPDGVGRDPVTEVHGAEGYRTYPEDTSGIVAPDNTNRIIGPMTEHWYDRAKARMSELGLNQADLMGPLGVRTRGAVGHYLTGRREPSPAQLLTLASILQVSMDYLVLGAGKGGIPKPISSLEATGVQIPSAAFRRVPVVGTASLGLDGYWTDLEYPAGHGDGYFEFPTKDRDAYSLQVKGNSMFPAIRSGWYVVIEPSKALQQGEFVLVKLKDGRSTVKEFLWQRDGMYTLSAVSNGERFVIPESEVEFVHHVGGILPPSGRQI